MADAPSASAYADAEGCQHEAIAFGALAVRAWLGRGVAWYKRYRVGAMCATHGVRPRSGAMWQWRTMWPAPVRHGALRRGQVWPRGVGPAAQGAQRTLGTSDMIQTLSGHSVRWKSVRWGRGGGWLEPKVGDHLRRGHPAAMDRHPNHIHH